MTITKNHLLAIAMMAITVFAVAFGLHQYRSKQADEALLNALYTRSFREAAAYVGNVEGLLKKAEAVDRPEQSGPMFADIWKQASDAHESLASLPYNSALSAKTLKYLSQVGDFSYFMMVKNMRGGEADGEDKDNMEKIREYSTGLANELNSSLSRAQTSGGLNWDELAKEIPGTTEGEALAALALGSMSNMNKNFQNYPALIYDGPFSDHIQDIKPSYLEGKSAITPSEGKSIVYNILSWYDVRDVELIGETTDDCRIPVYSYSATLGDTAQPVIYMDISKQGGYPLWMLNAQDIPYGGNQMPFNQAIGIGEEFLRQCGYYDMAYSYYEYSENTVTVNYAPIEKGIVMYPDLVKVKLNLSDGSVMGIEALGYINMHRDRVFEEPSLSPEDAMNYVSGDLDVQSVRLALIPKDSYREVLCYEFYAINKEGEKFLIYINGGNGDLEEIFLLLINENGILAM